MKNSFVAKIHFIVIYVISSIQTFKYRNSGNNKRIFRIYAENPVYLMEVMFFNSQRGKARVRPREWFLDPPSDPPPLLSILYFTIIQQISIYLGLG